jgi:hypothetical protein
MSTSAEADLNEERERTDLIRNRGKEGGLFRSCMDAIKKNHHIGQIMRQAFVLAGALTEKRCYIELLVQFYVTTKVLERFVHEKEIPVSKTVTSAYRFVDGYEKDLLFLIGDDWQEKVEKELTNDAAREYMALLETSFTTGETVEKEAALFGAVVILWGPLIIGGGYSLYQPVKKAFGWEATNVLQPILGSGREKRRNEFIETIDGLAEVGTDKFDKIVEYCDKFMNMNNKMMLGVKRTPFWMNYVYIGGAAIAVGLGAAVYYYYSKRTPEGVLGPAKS